MVSRCPVSTAGIIFTRQSSGQTARGCPVNRFSRPVTSRCMECHATFAKYDTALVKGQTIFDTGTLTLGIQCEKCLAPVRRMWRWRQKNLRKARTTLLTRLLLRVNKNWICVPCVMQGVWTSSNLRFLLWRVIA